MYRYFTKAAKGFTLIELLVVIAIIGILSSIVLASLNTARQKSRDARRVADIKQVQLAMQLYYDASSTYPTALSELAPIYIATIPSDPVAQAAYFYEPLPNGCTTACSSYHVGADLEDENNQALNSDQDDADTVFTATDDTTGCAGAADRYCYDVGP